LESSPCSSSHPVAAVTITIAVANVAANLNAAVNAVATKTAKRSLSAAAKVVSAARAAILSNRFPLRESILSRSYRNGRAFFVFLYLSMMVYSL
jgi:hypothetical protein